MGSAGEASSGSALETLVTAPLGRVLLVVMALGLACYAVWQAIEAAVGHRGQEDKKRVAKRVGSAGKAVLGLVLAGSAVALVAGSGGSGGNTEQEGASLLLGLPGGQFLLGLVGLVILGLGGYWVWSGITAHFEEKLSPGAPETVVKIGRAGYVAKGAAFVVLGGLFVLAAWRHDPSAAGGTGSAFEAMLDFPGGPYVLGAVALGLIAFGLFQIGAARYLREG